MTSVNFKFKKGDKVFFLYDNQVTFDHIDIARATVGQWKDEDCWTTTIEYALESITKKAKSRHSPTFYKETELFEDIEALAASMKLQTPKVA